MKPPLLSFQLKYVDFLSKGSSNMNFTWWEIYPRFGDKVVSVGTSRVDNKDLVFTVCTEERGRIPCIYFLSHSCYIPLKFLLDFCKEINLHKSFVIYW